MACSLKLIVILPFAPPHPPPPTPLLQRAAREWRGEMDDISDYIVSFPYLTLARQKNLVYFPIGTVLRLLRVTGT